MRLIDADALFDALNKAAWFDNADRDDIALELVLDAPTVDAAPVVHGRWNCDTCTHCKLPWNYNMVQDGDDWGYFDPMPDFCPNCGAKMDLPEDGE